MHFLRSSKRYTLFRILKTLVTLKAHFEELRRTQGAEFPPSHRSKYETLLNLSWCLREPEGAVAPASVSLS